MHSPNGHHPAGDSGRTGTHCELILGNCVAWRVVVIPRQVSKQNITLNEALRTVGSPRKYFSAADCGRRVDATSSRYRHWWTPPSTSSRHRPGSVGATVDIVGLGACLDSDACGLRISTPIISHKHQVSGQHLANAVCPVGP